jgi:fructokinase
MLKSRLSLPVAFDMDVNAAALGEFRWGAARGLDPCLYLTIGTGIGGGYVTRGKPLTGLANLEMGHIYLRRDPQRDPFPGSCPFHGDCFEGLAAGPSIRKRLGEPAESILAEHPFWELEADYIAQALAAYVLTLSPRRIVLGGGVMQNPRLFPLVRRSLLNMLGGYVPALDSAEQMETYVVPPGLGGQSGVLGAIAMAQELA